MAKKITLGQRFVEFYNQMSYDKIDQLDSFYESNVDFKDPLRKLHDLSELKKYLAYQYKNTRSCEFEIVHMLNQTGSSVVEWKMHLHHRFLNLGNEIEVQGCSWIAENEETGRILRHHDYFDTGAFVLNSIPGMTQLKRLLSMEGLPLSKKSLS